MIRRLVAGHAQEGGGLFLVDLPEVRKLAVDDYELGLAAAELGGELIEEHVHTHDGFHERRDDAQEVLQRLAVDAQEGVVEDVHLLRVDVPGGYLLGVLEDDGEQAAKLRVDLVQADHLGHEAPHDGGEPVVVRERRDLAEFALRQWPTAQGVDQLHDLLARTLVRRRRARGERRHSLFGKSRPRHHLGALAQSQDVLTQRRARRRAAAAQGLAGLGEAMDDGRQHTQVVPESVLKLVYTPVVGIQSAPRVRGVGVALHLQHQLVAAGLEVLGRLTDHELLSPRLEAKQSRVDIDGKSRLAHEGALFDERLQGLHIRVVDTDGDLAPPNLRWAPFEGELVVGKLLDVEGATFLFLLIHELLLVLGVAAGALLGLFLLGHYVLLGFFLFILVLLSELLLLLHRRTEPVVEAGLELVAELRE